MVSIEEWTPNSAPFLIRNPQRPSLVFAPMLYPETIRVRKQRELDRQSNFCKGEDVSDTGSKNREIHVTGWVRGRDSITRLNNVVDSAETFELISDSWKGEVRISEVEYEGPSGFHPPTGDQYWQYTIDLVSTGLDESPLGPGIISDGDPDTTGGGGSGEPLMDES